MIKERIARERERVANDKGNLAGKTIFIIKIRPLRQEAGLAHGHCPPAIMVRISCKL